MRKARKAPDFTPEEMTLIRAYRAAYMRDYRRKHKEEEKQRALRADLEKAKRAVQAGLLDVPGQDPKQDRPAL